MVAPIADAIAKLAHARWNFDRAREPDEHREAELGKVTFESADVVVLHDIDGNVLKRCQLPETRVASGTTARSALVEL